MLIKRHELSAAFVVLSAEVVFVYLKTLGPQVSQRNELPADILILCQNSTRSRPCLFAEIKA